MPSRFSTIAIAFAAVSAALLTSCSSPHPKISASVLLERTKTALNGAHSVAFKITSSQVDMGSTNLVGGSGVLVRPDGLKGSFAIAIDGFSANVAVASKGPVFEAKLPFASHYEKTNPETFGLTNPAELLDRQHGLVRLLAIAQNPTTASTRISGELVDTVSYDVPGSDIPVLPDSNPSQPVHMTLAVNPSNYQLRSVTLVGPLTTASHNTTYVVTFTDYDKPVTITLPASG